MDVVRVDAVRISDVMDGSGLRELIEEIEKLRYQVGVFAQIGDGISWIAKEAASARVEKATLKSEVAGGLSGAIQAAAADVRDMVQSAGKTGGLGQMSNEMGTSSQEAGEIKGRFMGFVELRDGAAFVKIGTDLSAGMERAEMKALAGGIASLAERAEEAAVNLGKLACQKMVQITKGIKRLAKGPDSVGKKDQNEETGLLKMAGLSTGMVEKAAGDVPVAVDAAGQLIQTAFSRFIQVDAQPQVSVAQGLMEQMAVPMPPAIQCIQTILAAGLGMLPQLVPMRDLLPISFAEGLAKMVPALIPMAVQAIHSFVTGLSEALPVIIRSGIAFLIALAGGILEVVPTLVSMTPELCACISWHQTGVNLMAGPNRGMAGIGGTLIATAQGIHRDVPGSANRSLSICRPSRVAEASGRYADLGLIDGKQSLSGAACKTDAGIGGRAAIQMDPVQSRYRPEGGVSARGSLCQTNHYSPSFNLTLNGASASDSNERKVKRWVREAMEEAIQGMGRTNPRLREV